MFESVDYFTDTSVKRDPTQYFDWVRGHGPVWTEPHHGVAIVTGYREALEVYRNPELFSSVNAATGPFSGLPLDELEHDDITPLLERYGHQVPLHDFMATMDPAKHDRYRALMAKMFSPKRLKENEDFMWRLADRQLDEILADTQCEFIHAYSEPFTTLVIADLLGVPDSDRPEFAAQLALQASTGSAGTEGEPTTVEKPFLLDAFTDYVVDRRRKSRGDVLSSLALATFPDGSRPEVDEVVREAVFLFVAGQETTARLLGAQMRILGEDPALQARLRRERELIPNFVEEALRLESPTKAHFRMTRRPTTLGGVDLPAGTTVMVAIIAINHDPDRFDDPHRFVPDRPNAGEHIAFIRGIHTCLGQALARAEARISLERILDRMGDIRISEQHHGPPGAHRYDYDETFLLQGLLALHLEFVSTAA
jgi:cytochrome P450